jgi:hypothetical protein
MAIGGTLGWRKFPVTCEGVVFSRIGGSSKAAQIPEEEKGSLERQREREREGWMGGGRESKVSAGSAPNPSHVTKMLGKTWLTKKAHKKSLTFKSKV